MHGSGYYDPSGLSHNAPEDLCAMVSIDFLSGIAIVGDLGIDVERPKLADPSLTLDFRTRPEAVAESLLTTASASEPLGTSVHAREIDWIFLQDW